MSLIPSFSLLVVGAIIIGAGLVRLDRLDRRRMDSYRQDACGWHQWQVHEEGAPPVCTRCGRRSGAPSPSRDPTRETISSDNILFP
jgi:hypothetical protein